MKKLIILLILISSSKVYADYGYAYYIECEIEIGSQILQGYTKLPYEYLPDSSLEKYSQSDRLLTRELTTINDHKSITIYDFVYKYQYVNLEGQIDYALFKSDKQESIKKAEITEIRYKNLIVFNHWGRAVSSKITKEDLSWLNTSSNLYKSFLDRDCCSASYYIHGENMGSEDLIERIEKAESSTRKELEKQLKKFKVIRVSDCRCG